MIRFTEEQNTRLHEVIRRGAKATVQAFIHEAAMVALVADEKNHREEDEYRERRKMEKRAKRQLDPSSGLGIRDRLNSSPLPSSSSMVDPEPPPPPPPPQIIVHAAPPPAPDADLDALTTYVVKGDGSRSSRVAAAHGIVTATSSNPQESARRKKVLDDKIATLDKNTKTTSSFFDVFDGLLK
jgi:hypothetical protein